MYFVRKGVNMCMPVCVYAACVLSMCVHLRVCMCDTCTVCVCVVYPLCACTCICMHVCVFVCGRTCMCVNLNGSVESQITKLSLHLPTSSLSRGQGSGLGLS